MEINFTHPAVVGGGVVGLNILYDIIKRKIIKKDSDYITLESKINKKADKTEVEKLEKSLTDFKKRIGTEIHETNEKSEDTNSKVTMLQKYMLVIMEKMGINTINIIDKG